MARHTTSSSKGVAVADRPGEGLHNMTQEAPKQTLGGYNGWNPYQFLGFCYVTNCMMAFLQFPFCGTLILYEL